MQITHVVRGEDLLLFHAPPAGRVQRGTMGVAEADFPVFAHLPYVLGTDGGSGCPSENGVVSVDSYRQEGYLPEAGAATTWPCSAGRRGRSREEFTLAEMAAEFDLARVNKNAAQFDVRKLKAINGDKIRALSPDDFAGRVLAVPAAVRAGRRTRPPRPRLRRPRRPARWCRSGSPRLTEAADMLCVPVRGRRTSSGWNPDDAAKVLTPDAAGAQGRGGGTGAGRAVGRQGDRGPR